ncbi:hypothetical protein [Streptomyces scabiei]|uniref:hypothetical protein n=1 Tax=Streptomyces scabiei TaxID=1930 RepID=UPI0039F615EE
MVGITLVQVTIGALSDTFGRRRALLTGLAVYVAEGAMCALAPHPAVYDGIRRHPPAVPEVAPHSSLS